MKETTEASYPAANHPLALGARGLSILPPPYLHTPPPPPPLVSLVHKKKVIEDEPLTVTPVSRRIAQGLQR